jgi:Cobalamin-independent synthase, Catalytic domain
VSGHTEVRVQEVPVPEPDLTPETVIARARAMIPAIRDQQDEAERLGHHTAELDRQFAEAGFYRILQPRRFGGYEFGLPTFWQVMLAVSAGDPGTGWGLTLGAHHALVVGAYFSEDGQRDIFGPAGDFRCPHRPPPMGTAEPAGKRAGEVGGGYVVSGTWDYCSGIAYATHFMGNAMVAGTADRIAVVVPAWRERAAATGVDPERQHEINLDVVNQALAGRPAGLTVTVHMCRGNYRSAWFSSGGYDFVAEAVFSGLQADGFFLEYDDERSGTFEPLRFVPDDKVVVLGLVTTKTPVLESADDLKRRVEAAARYVDADRLCLSPQCGFASVVEGNALTLDQQRAKLDLIVETAAELWGS